MTEAKARRLNKLNLVKREFEKKKLKGRQSEINSKTQKNGEN